MQQLTAKELHAVSGGDYNLVFMSVIVPTPTLPPSVANLISSLMMGQLNQDAFAQTLSEVGGNMVQFLTVSPACPQNANCPSFS